MSVEVIHELLTRRPFQPFHLHMANGKSCFVPAPTMAFLTRRDLIVGIEPDEEFTPAGVRICPLQTIASISFAPLSGAT